MALECKFEELDDRTREYLHTIRQREGRGAPGVYVPVGSIRPIIMAMIGPTVAFVFFFWAFHSTKAPWAVAMLQTAGILVGGWSILYACRRWLAGRSRTYAGYFAYFDPLHAYDVRGEAITVVSLKGIEGIEARADGTAGVLVFDFGDRRTRLSCTSLKAARWVEDYYDALDDLEHSDREPWATADAATLGAAAVYAANKGALPADAERLRLDLPDIPDAPTKTSRAGFGWPMLLAIPLAVAVFFLAFWQANIPLGDDAAFAQAKADGTPALRGYLLDNKYHTRHRAEAETLIAQAYDAPLRTIQNAAPGQQPELREAMTKLVESLRTPAPPVLSLSVTGPGSTGLTSDIVDSLGQTIGPALVAFVPPPEGVKPHIEIVYDAPNPQPGITQVTVTMTIRLDPKAEPIAVVTWELAKPDQTLVAMSVGDRVKSAVCTELVGEYRTPPPVLVIGDGDF